LNFIKAPNTNSIPQSSNLIYLMMVLIVLIFVTWLALLSLLCFPSKTGWERYEERWSQECCLYKIWFPLKLTKMIAHLTHLWSCIQLQVILTKYSFSQLPVPLIIWTIYFWWSHWGCNQGSIVFLLVIFSFQHNIFMTHITDLTVLHSRYSLSLKLQQ